MAKNAQTIDCALPRYDRDCKEWRQDVLSNARAALKHPDRWDNNGPFEVVALLYLTERQHDLHDVDNILKEILDGLQGAFYEKALGKKRDERRRLIRNDSCVCRSVVEKQHRPKKYLNRDDRPGGRLLIRPYSKCNWATLAGKATPAS